MARHTVEEIKYVLLPDVPREAYDALVNACPERRFRHTYLDGQLEMQSVLHEVQRADYEAILAAFGDRRFRHTYLDAELEVISPSEPHERIAEFIGRLVESLALEFDIDIKPVGSTTRRHPSLEQGLEPDQSYFIQHEPDVRSAGEVHDIPPDLMVEVDITHKSLKRLKVLATLGVPEVWRYRDGQLEFFCLVEDQYVSTSQSSAFPCIYCEDMSRAIDRIGTDRDNVILRDFIETARSRKT